MKTDDAELIQHVLDGNDDAFAQLMNKYQKPVQALAWRKIGDFHIAQEITQDTFLIVYKRLHTLKDPSPICWLDLCNSDAPMPRLAPQKTYTYQTVGGC